MRARALERVHRRAHRPRAAPRSVEPAELSPAAEARAEASIRWTRVAPTPPVRRPFLVGLGVAAAAAAAVVVWNARAPRRAAYASTPAVARPPADAGAARAPIASRRSSRSSAATSSSRAATTPARKLSLDVAPRRRRSPHHRAGTGRAAAQWSEGSGFLLYGDAELTLARLEPHTQRLELGRGQISVRVGPHEPGESLHVITPDHVVSVHGTWFTVASAAHTTTVEVLEGTVEVTERDGSSSTLLTAPARATFGRGRAARRRCRVTRPPACAPPRR